jgi:hypothetical protein
LTKYARVLLKHSPKEATRLFIDYYTGTYKPQTEAILPITNGTSQGGTLNAMQNLAALIPLPYINMTRNASQGNQKAAPSEARTLEENEETSKPEYNVPKPRTAFSLFIDHPDEFIVFLETCLKESELEEADKTDLYTTLLEMYLYKAKDKTDEERAVWEAKAKQLIEDPQVVHSTII